jgi:predicted DNA-binding transcriptional regulator AlpA
MEQHETKIQDRLEEIHPIYDDSKLAGKHFITSVCPECGKTFRHWKRTTVYCGNNCQRRASRRQLKEANARCIEERAKNYQRQKLADEEFLSITKSSILLNISRSSVYRLIAKGTLHPLKITRRIVRLAVKELMTLSPAIEKIKTPKEELKSMAIKLMSKSEVLETYHISSNWLITKLKRAGFKPTIIDGKAFYKPEEIKKTFSMPQYNNINSWYTVPEICEKENVTPAHIRDYVKTYNIPK